MLENLQNIDRAVTLAVNGIDSLYADGALMLVTSTLTWIPAGFVLLYVVVRNNDLPHIAALFALLAMCVAFSSGLSEICKALSGRWRPSCDPLLMYCVRIVNGYRESGYGFFSAHSANTMSVAVFASLLFRKRGAALLFVVWSLLNGFSRIYLGVHYAGDVATGFLVGMAVGCMLYFVYTRILKRLPVVQRTAHGYTPSGYLCSDVEALCTVLLLTFGYVLVAACVWPV